MNWHLEYKNEFCCPHCKYGQLIFRHDTSKGVGLSLECKSCPKTTALTCKVPAYIYNYQCSLECPNPLCTQLGHDGQKGWIYKVGDKTGNCKCYFCGIIFNPKASGLSSWISSQTERELLLFNFADNSWNIRHFGYKHRKIKHIYFSDIHPNWYILLVKQYAYYLLKFQVFSVSGIAQRVGTLKQFSLIIEQHKLQTYTEIDRQLLLTFFDNCQNYKAITFHNKLTFIKHFFEWLKLDDKYLIRQRDFPKLRNNDPEWLDEVTRTAIKQHLSKIPAPIACHYQVQEYTAARPVDVCQIAFDCLVEENGKWYIKFYQHKVARWHKLPATRDIRRVIEEQQQWIRQTLGSDYPYLFCHFRAIRTESYPSFPNIKPLPMPPKVNAEINPMVRIIRLLIEREKIQDANGLSPHFTGKITRSSRLQEVRVKYGMEAAQLYADHVRSATTFQHYAPATREQVAHVDLPFQALLMNPDNKFLPWQSLPESLLKNPKAHELDIEIAPRLVIYGHCALNPKTPCPHNLYPKCYGCSSFRPSTSKLSLYERQYAGEQERLQQASYAGAELAYEEAKTTVEAMDKWLPQLRRLANE
ncbi:MAG TPA: integrase [Cyanobacteria bacterium UBA11049]|nr:integrase [Cyanobacteria bacterium UBA11049]